MVPTRPAQWTCRLKLNQKNVFRNQPLSFCGVRRLWRVFSRKRKTDLESCFKHIAPWMSTLLLVALRTKNGPRGQLWRQLLMWLWLPSLTNSIKIERNMRNHWRVLRHCRTMHLLLCPGSGRGFFLCLLRTNCWGEAVMLCSWTGQPEGDGKPAGVTSMETDLCSCVLFSNRGNLCYVVFA